MQPEDLKSIRKQTGLSQEEFAAALGLSRVHVGQMERGNAPVEPRTALAARTILSDTFQVTLAPDGPYTVTRRLLAGGGLKLNQEAWLYGSFVRRDHAYRWLAALRAAPIPRWTRQVERWRALYAHTVARAVHDTPETRRHF